MSDRATYARNPILVTNCRYQPAIERQVTRVFRTEQHLEVFSSLGNLIQSIDNLARSSNCSSFFVPEESVW